MESSSTADEDVLDEKKDADRIEGEEICDKMLTLIESNPFMNPVPLYQHIGVFHFNVGTIQSLKKAKYHYLKARNACYKFWNGESLQFIVRFLDTKLAEVEAQLGGDDSLPKTREKKLSSLRSQYNFMLQRHGEDDVVVLRMGGELAAALFNEYHTIEALRFLSKLVATSRRVHGSSHKRTKYAESLWRQMNMRYVFVGQELYQALRYENDGNSCIIQGPVPITTNLLGECRNLDDEKMFSVPSADMTISLGTLVMFHGLKKAAHLNGKIGEIRGGCMHSNRHVLHFEDKSLKPVKVKQENLRIVFDLPDPKTHHN